MVNTSKIEETFKCNVCGNIVTVLTVGGGELVCCNQPMELVSLKTEDVGKEKHLPVVESIEGGVKVKVGSVEHPMADDHFIEWIEIMFDNGQRSYMKYLKQGDKPEVIFSGVKLEDISFAKTSCNIHGIWRSK